MARHRKFHGLGDTPKGHAYKAVSLESVALRDFKATAKPGRTCKAAFAIYSNALLTFGEAKAHRLEAYGHIPKKEDRGVELEKASEAAYAAIRGCLTDGSLSGLGGRRSRRRR